ncbi:CPBP family intramembrane glutamic endopeptidase [Oligoflexus tunisiensis]|uniref:CPBP family intramembrane glutamic endopeptidase n=1 Tax=Oligoflexus tunisiensis TaxID=708132 RepID=UPI00114C8DC8|nr:type II CAAX endopeptidase family protein [Oligoflexus tunisiensis]
MKNESRRNLAALLLAIAYICAGPLMSSLSMPPLRMLFDGIAALSILILLKDRRHEPVPLSPPWAILFILGGIMIATILTGAWVELVTVAEPAQEAVIATGKIPPIEARSSLQNLSVLVLGPTVEEIIYRLAILGGLSHLIGKAPALIISAMVFAAVHADVYPVAILVPMFIMGILLGITFFLLGLPWAIVTHMFNNMRPLILESNALTVVVAVFSIWGMWVFLSRTIRLRRSVFGGW